MHDVECPYCGKGVEINHDDGYGYGEDEKYEQECPHCDKVFGYTTTIILMHDAFRADCLNGADHAWEPTATYPVEYTKMKCSVCGERREPTDQEKIDIGILSLKSSGCVLPHTPKTRLFTG